MGTADWLGRLEDTFISDELGFQMVSSVFQSEKSHATRCVSELRGHKVMIESLQSFLLQTFSIMNTRSDFDCPSKRNFGLLTFEFSQFFRLLRSCDILYLHGYPLTAYVNQRTIRDKCFSIAAIANSFTTTEALLGFNNPRPTHISSEEIAKMRKRSVAEESLMFNRMLRKATDLGAHKTPLLKWERLFNREVHGQQLSLAQFLTESQKNGTSIPIAPEYDENMIAAYVNRSVELGWMITRLIPLVQPKPNYFDKHWQKKWDILDDSYSVYNDSHKGLGSPGFKELAEAIEYFVNLRFKFVPAKNSYLDCLE